jgi:hypothetical protein
MHRHRVEPNIVRRWPGKERLGNDLGNGNAEKDIHDRLAGLRYV